VDLESLAVENAVEGCVRESMGAVIAAHQATHARDRAVARAMRRIAADEARHAALAWAIDAWIATRLTPGARERVRAAKRAAVAELQRDAAHPVSPEVVAVAGLPPAGRHARLVEAFARAFA
jgi:hypothetical protein